MMRNLKISDLITSLIEDNIQLVDRSLHKKEIRGLFRISFEFLKNFVKYNKEN